MRVTSNPARPAYLLRKMNVRKDMILTEAVIPHALAAVSELQIGIVCVRAAADGALVVIAHVLLPLLLVDGLAELRGLTRVAVAAVAVQIEV